MKTHGYLGGPGTSTKTEWTHVFRWEVTVFVKCLCSLLLDGTHIGWRINMQENPHHNIWSCFRWKKHRFTGELSWSSVGHPRWARWIARPSCIWTTFFGWRNHDVPWKTEIDPKQMWIEMRILIQVDPQLTSHMFRMKGWNPTRSSWSNTLQIIGIRWRASIYQTKNQVCFSKCHTYKTDRWLSGDFTLKRARNHRWQVLASDVKRRRDLEGWDMSLGSKWSGRNPRNRRSWFVRK